MGKMAFRMRSSKFRHVYGSPTKKEMCYECIKITKNAHDSNFCAVNPKFVAIVTESAGGGAFLVLPLEKVGRVDINAFKVCGHSGPVLDIKWNPFDDNVIASCSDDATVKLWQIPEGGLTSNLTEWLVDMHGHQRRVGHIVWHPTAQNILLSAGYDHKCILWNTETAEPVNIISVHNDTIFSIAWNHDGSFFATTSKDKKIRIIDPREGDIVQEGQGHAGSKSSKVTFVGNNRLFTTGFSRMSERQYAVWDAKNLSRPLAMEVIDASSGVLFPYYDADTNVVFVAGKGDGNIRYYELVDDAPYCHYLNQYQSSSPQRGLGIIPKRGIDPSRCEITRFYKLHAVKGICEPISMIVPRKSEMFQEDIFPPTASACPSLSADEWISGQNRQPILISLKDGSVVSVPASTVAKAVKRKSPEERAMSSGRSASSGASSGLSTNIKSKARIPPSAARSSKKDSVSKKDSKREALKKDSAKKDGAISNSPVITTYKAVKRGVAAVSTSHAERGQKRQSTSPPTATVAPSQGRLPASIHNIRKMTSVDDSDRENQNEDLDNNENNNTVNERISSFEKKTGVNVTKSVMRLTNNNQPLRVERKVWSSSYTGVNANMNVPATNGMPRTDPERDASLSPRPQAGTTTVSTNITETDTTHLYDTPQPKDRSLSLSSSALEQAEQELYANLRIDNPRPRRRSERNRSQLSDSGSELFTTPPMSPEVPTSPRVCSRDSPRPRAARADKDKDGSLDASPANWNCNPLYVTSRSPPARTRDSPRGRIPRRATVASSTVAPPPAASPKRTAREEPPEADGDCVFSRDGPLRRSLPPSLRGSRADSSSSTVSSASLRTCRSSVGVDDINNNDANKLTPVTFLNGEDSPADSGYLELEGCFPADAPDNTLVKPSKLRASLRGRRRLTNGSSSDAVVERQSETCISPTPPTEVGGSSASSTQIRLEQPAHQPPPQRSPQRIRNVIIVENKARSRSSIASCSAQENVAPSGRPHALSTRHGSTTTTTTTPQPTDQHSHPIDKLNTNANDALIKPSRMRDQFRRRDGRQREQEPVGKGSSIRTKKVWSSSSEPSPTSPPPDNSLRMTEAELRKAYFRQVEEISSLKEQIGLKDKRIRQLEEEVRVLRDGRDLVGESTC